MPFLRKIPALLALINLSPVLADDLSDTLLKTYQVGAYEQCLQVVENRILVSRPLKSTEKILYAECLFQRKRYRQSGIVLNQVLKEDKINQLRAANRMLDIYKLGEQEIPLRRLVDFLESDPRGGHISMQLQPLLLENNRNKDFLRLFKKKPVHLNKQRWSLVTANLNEQEFATVVELARLDEKRKKMRWAQFWLTQGYPDKAMGILDEVLQLGLNFEAIKLKTSIYWEKENDQKALNTLYELKAIGSSGYREVAEFLFANQREKLASQVIKEGLEKKYNLHDLQIFYTMSMADFSHAAYLLEKYLAEKKLPSYRYHSLKQDFFRQGTEEQYYAGLKKLLPEHPSLCEKAIAYQLDFDNQQNISKSIAECGKLQKPAIFKGFLFSLVSKKKYELVVALLEKKTPLALNEEFLLGKSYLLLNQPQPEKALSHLQVVQQNQQAFNYKNELFYFLGLAQYYLRNFNQAEAHFASVDFKDSVFLLLNCLVYQEKFDQMQTIINSKLVRRYYIESLYFRAVWSLSKKQLKQAETLLEQYLEDAGQHGNQAVYLLFMLKYFSQNEQLQSLVKILVLYPLGLDDQSFKVLSKTINSEVQGEFDAFVHYWYARYLLLKDRRAEAEKRLKDLSTSSHARLLSKEISFLLLDNETKQKDYLMSFPNSPFKILMPKPKPSQ